MARVTVADVQAMKQRGEKIVMLTAYDYPSARIADEAGVDMILVGDSLGMVVLGYDSTLPVTHGGHAAPHAAPSCAAASTPLVVTDLPFMSYQVSVEEAMRNAGRLLQEGGAQAVKLEGGVHMAETVRRIVQVGIPVVGHIGLTPQSINQLSGYKVQGTHAGSGGAPAGRRRRAAAGGRLRHRPRDDPGAAGRADQQAPAHPDHRHRRRGGLRRAGAGLARPALLLDDLPAAAHPPPRQAVRERRRGHARRRSRSTPRRCAAGTFPTLKESFQMDPQALARADRGEAHERSLQVVCRY